MSSSAVQSLPLGLESAASSAMANAARLRTALLSDAVAVAVSDGLVQAGVDVEVQMVPLPGQFSTAHMASGGDAAAGSEDGEDAALEADAGTFGSALGD